MYVLVKNNEGLKYPYGLKELQKDHPNTSFPKKLNDDLMAIYDAFPVFPIEKPSFNPSQKKCVEGMPQFINNEWTQTWQLVDLTQEELQEYLILLQSDIIDQTQKRLDEFARTRLYEGILSLCSYQNSPNLKFRTEGQYGVEARDATWSKLYEMFNEALAGTRPIPSGYEDIASELPVLEWPN